MDGRKIASVAPWWLDIIRIDYQFFTSRLSQNLFSTVNRSVRYRNWGRGMILTMVPSILADEPKNQIFVSKNPQNTTFWATWKYKQNWKKGMVWFASRKPSNEKPWEFFSGPKNHGNFNKTMGIFSNHRNTLENDLKMVFKPWKCLFFLGASRPFSIFLPGRFAPHLDFF